MNAPTPSANPLIEILIAEDSPTQAERLRHILEQQGYRVTHAANGRLALEAARRQKPTIIISDVVMPEMDGYELCRRVKTDASLSDIPVILVTTLSDPRDVMRGLECRADNFILKPYDEHYLLGRVQFVLLNREVLQTERATMGGEIYFNGQRHFITADRLQILNLLLSTYDAAIQRTKELIRAQEELSGFNRLLSEANLRLEQEIGEREKAEQALRASEENLAVTLQSIGDAVLGTDAAGRVTRLNTVAETLTGWTQAEATGRPVGEIFRIINGETRQPALIPVADTLAKGTIHGLANHTLLIARDGTERPIADSCAPIRNREGEVIGAVLVFWDVTEQRQTTLKFDQLRRQQELIFNAVADGLHGLNLDGTINFQNPAAERMLGFDKGEELGKPAHLTIHHHRADGSEYPVEQCPIHATLRDGETRIVRDEVFWRKDGTSFAVEYVVSGINDELGRRIGAIVAFRDVTEHQQQEEAVRASQQELAAAVRANQLIMEHSQDVICTIDGQGRFDFVSAACVKFWGYQPQELAGRQYIDLVYPEDHPATNQAAADIMAGRPVLNFENRYRRKDGTLVPVMWSVSWSAADQRMFCVAHDVTEQKQAAAVLQQAHQELSRANAELDRASRHKDEFLANMSHELRTPLNAILGLSEALLEQVSGTLTPRQIKSVTTISTSGAHLLALINDILDLSKIEAGKLELNLDTVNVAEFCESCLLFVRTQAVLKRIGVAFEHDGRVTKITADPKRLKQILVNLLTNAMKFTPEGGRIGLTVAAPEGEDVVRFTVWDTGIGIAKADATTLFRAFTQIDSGLSRAQEGTGLGLALVAKLVELHGGSVALESEPGQGSRFIVTLPQIAVPAAASALEPAPEARLDRRGYRRALIIEDDPTSGAILANYLTELGLSSVLHLRGEESVEAALRERPDVILLDVQLPAESGWGVLTRLKEHPGTRDIPVVIVTVVDEPQKSRALGAAAHFTKPVTREQLASFLQRAIEPRGPAAPPFVAQPSPTGPLILLAEDNEANVQTIGDYLEEKGYAMHHAMNGLVAVKFAREFRPALILMDIQMPVMDGLTAIREIRADAAMKNIPIVALTALAMPGDRERCLTAGATDYMSKPVRLKALAELVKRLLPTAKGGRKKTKAFTTKTQRHRGQTAETGSEPPLCIFVSPCLCGESVPRSDSSRHSP